MRWKTWIGLLVSAVFLVLSFRKVDWTEMRMAMGQAHYVYILPSVALVMAGFWLRAFRWKILLAPVQKLRTHVLFGATMIGFMANNVLPARLGEFVRADALARQAPISRSTAFAPIVVERLFDGMALLLFLAGTLAFSSFPDWVRRGAVGAMALYGLCIAFLYLLHSRTDRMVRLAEYLLNPFPARIKNRLIDQLRLFASGLDVLTQGHHLISTTVLSVVLWTFNVLSLQCILTAFDLRLPFYAPFTVTAILALGVILPSSPGFVGVVQGFSILALGLFGVSRSVALAFSVVYHASGYVPVTAVGLFYFSRAHLSFKNIQETPKEIS